MKVMSKLITSFIIYLCSFQMAFGQVASDFGQTSVEDKQDLIMALSSFSDVLRGDPTCTTGKFVVDDNSSVESDQSIDETLDLAQAAPMSFEDDSYGEEVTYQSSVDGDYFKFVNELNENSCKTSKVVMDAAPKAKQATQCNTGRGLVEIISKKISEIKIDEVNQEIDLESQSYFRMTTKILRDAKKLKVRVENYIRSNADEDEKREVIFKYITAVPVSIRDLAVILNPESTWANSFKKDYMIEVPSELFQDWMDEWTWLQTGKNPSVDPYFLELIDHGDFIEMKFDEHQMITRDIQTFMQFPSARNYVYALRMLTVKTMAAQVKNYDVFTGDFSAKVEMPKSCIENKTNGHWPKELKFEIKEEFQVGYVDRILENHGITYSNSSQQVMSYFIEDAKTNPLSDALYGSVEFDELKNSNKAMIDEENRSWYESASKIRYDWKKPAFDDITTFAKFEEMKKNEAKLVYRDEFSTATPARGSSRISMGTYRDSVLFDEIYDRVPNMQMVRIKTIEKGQEREVEINPFAMNLSKFLVNQMIKLSAVRVEDIIDTQTLNTLMSNEIKIDMPTLFSPHTMRNWGIRKIHSAISDIINSDKKEDAALKRAVQVACYTSKSNFCANNKGANLFIELDNYLSSLEQNGAYLPIKKLQEREIESTYGLLFHLWRTLRDRFSYLSDMKITEYDYLLSQLEAGNDLARLRLGYLLARQQIISLKNGKAPTYINTGRGKRVSFETKCHTNEYQSQLVRLDEAASVMYLDQPLRPLFLTTYLSNDEQVELWGKIKDEVNKTSSQLFTAKIGGTISYDLIEKVAQKTILSEGELDSAVSEILDGDISTDTQEKIGEQFAALNLEKLEFFRDLMREKSHAQRMEMYKAKVHEVGAFSEKNLKEMIVETDMALKKPLYKEILKRSAAKRKQETLKQLEEFCATPIDDIKSIQKQFYSTMKVQDELNQMLGLPAAPKELMDRVQEMYDEELINIGLAVGGFFLAMGGVMAGGACAAVTMGLCAPLAVAAGVAMQSYVLSSEVSLKLDGDKMGESIDKMNDLGLTSNEASNNVTRSWAWAMIEAISIVPFAGLAIRAVTMGSKMTKVMTKTLVNNAPKVGFGAAYKQGVQAGKAIGQEAEVEFAKLVLGFSGYGEKLKALTMGKNLDDAKIALQRANLAKKKSRKISAQIQRMKSLQAQGKVSATEVKIVTKKILKEINEEFAKDANAIYKYSSSVISDYSFKSIDSQTAKVVTEYFGNNPREMKGFLDTYMKKFRNKWMIKGKVRKSSSLAKAKLGYKKAQRGEYLWGTNWMKSAWYENTFNMAKKRASLLKISDELSKVPANELEGYILKNIDTLGDVFAKLPMRKRDIPYLLIQGGPHVGGILNGRRLPVVQEVGEAIVVRKLFVARARLIQETAKSTAREALGASKVVAADTVSTIFKNFYTTVTDEAARIGGNEGVEMLKQLDVIKKDIISHMYDVAKSNPKLVKYLKTNGVITNETIDQARLEKLIFNPKTDAQEVVANQIWGYVKTDKVFGKTEVDFLSHNVMKEMVSDQSVQGVQKYMAMMKVLMLKDGMAVVELF